MSESIRKQAEALFHRAVDLSPEDRARMLHSTCEGQPALRAEVESLLAEFDAGTVSYLKGADDENPKYAPEMSEGQVVGGKFKLLEVLGEGGLGVVWLAEQSAPVRRNVALKVIKLGMDSKQVLARFDVERNVLTMMDHPNIARVLDAGTTESGQPFFAMEHVAGLSITEFCDTERLTTTERLRVFLKVCAAVQHAHQKGIIHRDLKPSNVLVTLQEGEPVPKVIDFGVAKATSGHLTENTLFTMQGQLLGTPEYMSPEQAEMSAVGVDSTSDIYSLGVMLYELLTGVLPFDSVTLRSEGLAGISKRIRESEAQRPSTRVTTLGAEGSRISEAHGTDPRTLRSELTGDLDWIAMKALEKQRTRRYASASEFAADIERHLHHEPVLAGPPSARYRIGKFVRRNRTLVASASLVLLALLAGIIVAAMAWRDARVERDHARDARQDAETQLRHASAVRDFLLYGIQFWDGRPDSTLTVADMMERTEREMSTRFAKDRLSEAYVRTMLGMTYCIRGLHEHNLRAIAHLEKAVALMEAELGAAHVELVQPLGWLVFARQLAYGDRLGRGDKVLDQARKRAVRIAEAHAARASASMSESLRRMADAMLVDAPSHSNWNGWLEPQRDRIEAMAADFIDRCRGAELPMTNGVRYALATAIGHLDVRLWNRFRFRLKNRLLPLSMELLEDVPNSGQEMMSVLFAAEEGNESDIPRWKRFLQLARQHLPEAHWYTASGELRLGIAFLRLERHDLARKHLHETNLIRLARGVGYLSRSVHRNLVHVLYLLELREHSETRPRVQALFEKLSAGMKPQLEWLLGLEKPDADVLAGAARLVARFGDFTPDVYKLGLDVAKKAFELRPKKHRLTLARARYRVGDYEEALELLGDGSTWTKLDGACALGYIAMSQARLGNRDAADRAFRELKRRVAAPEFAMEFWAHRFYAEAAAVLGR